MIKFIELTQGQFAIVDAEDFEHLDKFGSSKNKEEAISLRIDAEKKYYGA